MNKLKAITELLQCKALKEAKVLLVFLVVVDFLHLVNGPMLSNSHVYVILVCKALDRDVSPTIAFILCL